MIWRINERKDRAGIRGELLAYCTMLHATFQGGYPIFVLGIDDRLHLALLYLDELSS